MDDEELGVEQTPGYKIQQPKGSTTYVEKEFHDKSMDKWMKENGGNQNTKDTSLTILDIVISSPDLKAPVTCDLSRVLGDDPDYLKNNPVIIKKGVQYSVDLRFRVDEGVVLGLKYIHNVKKGPVTLDKSQIMLGSYAAKEGEKKVEQVHVLTTDAPGGLVGASISQVNAKARLVDDDNKEYAKFAWTIKFEKDWPKK